MIRYIPPFIVHQYRHKRFRGSFEGFVLFFDIADFTKLGNRFRQHGKKGAEELSRFLETIFRPAIKIIDGCGGFISVFAGDAFCSIFPGGKPENVAYAVNAIRRHFHDNEAYSCELGSFEVKVRMTVCSGGIDWQIFDNDLQCEYAFFGPVLEEVAQLSGFKKDVIVSSHAAGRMEQRWLIPLETGFDLRDIDIEHEPQSLRYDYYADGMRWFSHDVFCGEKPDNEIRDAAFCFVDFTAVSSDRRGEVIAELHRILVRYGGLLNKLDATDKGLVGLILFGMPRTTGNTLERICRFALEAVETLSDLALGIACGSVFAGYTGSGAIREYTALGDAVNLAARLMGKADRGVVIADTYLRNALRDCFTFEDCGFIELKGFQQPVNIFRLRAMRRSDTRRYQSEFVGREAELALIEGQIQAPDNRIVYVSGDPGIGKSRLIDAAIDTLGDASMRVFKLFCDPVVQKPLEPIRQLFRQHFDYDPAKTTKQNRGRFRTIWDAGDDPELRRIESILASVLGLDWEGSVWGLLTDDERSEQLQRSVEAFFRRMTEEGPIVIQLDDPQWIDPSTHQMLNALGEASIPTIHILAACRFLQDGKAVDLSLPGFDPVHVTLDALSPSGSVALIHSILHINQVPDGTIDLIVSRSQGNPLFIEQLTTLLLEQGFLDAEGYLTGDNDNLSTFGISDIIGSRIDYLADSVRKTLQHASVLGIEFNVRVLSEMLRMRIDSELDAGKSSRVWSDLDELRYIFTHVLIKDTAYQRMMSDRLKKLHLLAAESLLNVYADNPDEFAHEIGNHFSRAEWPVEAAKWWDIAGKHYREHNHFEQAKALLRRAYDIRCSHLGDHVDTAGSINNLASLMRSLGRYEEAIALFREALDMQERLAGERDKETILFRNNLADTLRLHGDFDEAYDILTKTLAICEDTGQLIDVTLNNLAGILDVQGRMNEVAEMYERALAIRRETLSKDDPELARSINNLGGTYVKLGKFEEAEPLLLDSLEIWKKAYGEEHLKTALAMGNLANLYSQLQGSSAMVEHLYRKSLQIVRSILGKRHPKTATAIGNLAAIIVDQSPAEAEDYFREAMDITQEVLGPDHPSTSLYRINLATLLLRLERFDEAEEAFRQSLESCMKCHGENHPVTGSLISNLAGLYRKQNRYDEALEMAKRSLKVKQSVLGERHPDNVYALNTLALTYIGMDRYDQAKPLLEEALELLETALGKEHLNTGILLLNYGTLLVKMEHSIEAEQVLKRSESILVSQLPQNHPLMVKLREQLKFVLSG